MLYLGYIYMYVYLPYNEEVCAPKILLHLLALLKCFNMEMDGEFLFFKVGMCRQHHRITKSIKRKSNITNRKSLELQINGNMSLSNFFCKFQSFYQEKDGYRDDWVGSQLRLDI